MGIKFDMNMWKMKDTLLSEVKPRVIEASRILYQDIIPHSPVKTWQYKSTIRQKDIIQKWNTLTWWVENIWEYVEKVETGWRKKAVNWNLADWTIKTSKWANVFGDSVQRKQKTILKILKW